MIRTLARSPLLLVTTLLAVVASAAGVYYWYAYTPADGVETFTDQYALTLGTYEGKEIHLSEFKRELLVIHAWASWCTYCVEELQTLARLKGVYGDDVQILAVNRAEPEDVARGFTDNLHLGDSIEILLDPTDSLYKEIEGYAMPETVFINKRGEIIFHQRGPMKFDEVVAQIDTLIGKK